MGNLGYGLGAIRNELIELGFEGLFLKKLLLVIDDNEALQEFKNWILTEDLKGERHMKLSYVNRFKLHMEDKYIISFQIFENDYRYARTAPEKERVILALIPNSNSIKLNKVLYTLNKNPEKLSDFYNKVREYRRICSPDEVIHLLETLPF
jgi:hypothetical protein